MSHSDPTVRLSKQTRRILKQLRKQGAYSSNSLSQRQVLYLELVDRAIGCLTFDNLGVLEAKLLDCFGSVEGSIERLRSGKIRILKMSLRSGAGVFFYFANPEDDESLVDLWSWLLKKFGDEAEEVAARILDRESLARAVIGALVREGMLVRDGDEARPTEHTDGDEVGPAEYTGPLH